MEHLSTEILARLVDEEPRTDEADHLADCEGCATELVALREQTESLGALPELLPPKGDWQVLEAQLRSEGLVQTPGVFQKLGLAQTPQWMRAAAAVLLFLSGAGAGAMLTGGAPADLEAATVEDAAFAVRTAEETYVRTMAHLQELVAREGGNVGAGDPITRYAAIEALVSVSQAAVRQAPADPFFNGLLASMLAEREAVMRLVSASGDNWF